jgi:putative SOS response-associated peptidase YedK
MWIACLNGRSVVKAALYKPRYNLAPTDGHWLVRLAGEQPSLVPGRWGVRRESSKYSTLRGNLVINVQAERVARGAFRGAFAERRCIAMRLLEVLNQSTSGVPQETTDVGGNARWCVGHVGKHA